MKKMLKWLVTMFCGLLCICFSGCNWQDVGKVFVPPTLAPSTDFYGVVRTLEEYGGLVVDIPNTGVCTLPSAVEEGSNVFKDGFYYKNPLKEGDLIRLRFQGTDIAIAESYPAKICAPYIETWVYRENIGLNYDDGDWMLTMPTADWQDSDKVEENDVVVMWKALFLTGEGQGSCECGSAKIESKDAEKLIFRLYPDEGIALFLKYFASGALVFRADLENQG